MSTPDFQGIAKVFWSGRSQAVRLPAQCRFETSEVEIVKVGDEVTLRPRGKNWRAWFDCGSRGSLPPRDQPAIEERDEIR
ncbi:MAG: type II toxin-antitoxin system VapB family antitoxin [Gemmatimonadaceae bacterium]|nr:type II toxin-antitoxin system VapB family antitoxin [Gemmatimonadaceae bacterium]